MVSTEQLIATRQETDYARIARAIDYIRTHAKTQPSLEDVAAAVHLSPFHFQRLFTAWAGVSPKQFLQYLNLGHAKKMLEARQSLFETAVETGLSGTGRLHDMFVKIEGMTPGEYKNGGADLSIEYTIADTIFGRVIAASTHKGICHIAFAEGDDDALAGLAASFPNARLNASSNDLLRRAIAFLNHSEAISKLKLHLKGTPFQIKVWEALLKIPAGKLTTYGSIAAHLQQPTASRAVGSAVGDNPIAYLIPCHRVIQSTGHFGQYMWGSTRKTAMIGWEAAKTDHP